MAKLGREAIMEAVHGLPAEERVEIARAILAESDEAQAARLEEVARELDALHAWLTKRPAVRKENASAAGLRGIARMEAPPDDATVERWLDEHRMEKFGG